MTTNNKQIEIVVDYSTDNSSHARKLEKNLKMMVGAFCRFWQLKDKNNRCRVFYTIKNHEQTEDYYRS